MNAVHFLGMEFSAINEESSLIAARLWRQYRQSRGKKNRISSDFLMGAHAMIQCDRLLTRDHGFYRKYFTQLKIVTP